MSSINMSTGLQLFSVVTGANGFIARWLITKLTSQGRPVLALLRDRASRTPELRAWIQASGGDASLVHFADFDLMEADLGLSPDTQQHLQNAQAVFHLAAKFGFGLDPDATRKANVTAAERLLELVAPSPHLKRFVHITGYRSASPAAMALNIDDESALAEYYRQHGSYEASKMEAHERVRRRAAALQVPLTRISPAMVIGDSRTGQTSQSTGLAEILEKLWQGRLPAMVGGAHTWLPVVAVDTLAELLAALPFDEDSAGQHYVVFDDETPQLPELIQRAASRMQRTAPRWSMPAAWMRRIPESLSGVHPEALSFISDDRYDPQPLQTLMGRLKIEMPDVHRGLDRWVDYLIDTHFLTRPAKQRRSVTRAGTRAFVRGASATAQAAFLHGVMLNEHSWVPVSDRVGVPSVAVDLPGLGRSAPNPAPPGQWLTAVLGDASQPLTLVAHSLGTAFAVDYAALHPRRVKSLLLISPFFLQKRPSWLLRQSWLMQHVFRWAPRRWLAEPLEGPLDEARADALALLANASVSRHTARWLSWAGTERVRRAYTDRLSQLQVPTTLLVGEHDPVQGFMPDGVEVLKVQGAGHHPQLTHPEQVARAATQALSRERRSPGDVGLAYT